MVKLPVFAVLAPLVDPAVEPICRHGRIAHDHLAEFALQAHHLLRRDILRALGYAVDQADILDREKSLRRVVKHDAGERHGGEKDAPSVIGW